jgi:hypothetical protein
MDVYSRANANHTWSDSGRVTVTDTPDVAGVVTDRRLGYVAVFLAYVVALVHLFHPELGVARLSVLLATDPSLLAYDPRPLLFVLLGVVVLGGVKLALVDVPNRVVYALGIAVSGAAALGYVAWHLTGHGGFLPGRQALYHGLAPHEALLDHLATSVPALVSIVAEVALCVVLAALYVRDA